MGREHRGKWKHLLLYGAGFFMITFILWGCVNRYTAPAHVTVQEYRVKAESLIQRAKTEANNGHYVQAMIIDKKIRDRFPHTGPGDQAVFHMGMIWADPKNPGMNYKKAIYCFRKVLIDYPESRLKMEARVLIHMIKKVWAKEKRTKLIEEENRLLREKVEGLKVEIEKLHEQLKKIKEVDITTQEKKLAH